MTQASVPERGAFRRYLPGATRRQTLALRGVSIEEYHLGDLDYVGEHAEHLVSVQLGGGATLFQERERRQDEHRLCRGEVIVTPAGPAKRWRRSGPGEALLVAFSPQFMDQFLEEATGRHGAQADLVDSFGAPDPEIAAIGLALHDELGETGLGSELYLDALVRQLAVALLRRHAMRPLESVAPGARISPHRLRQVREHIEVHLADALDIACLARIACMSPFHFAHAFRAATGKPPHRYVTERRMERAKVLLRDTQLPLADIAQSVGYSTQSHFSVGFRKHVQVPPGEYRRRG